MLKTSSLVTLINTLNYPDIYSLRSQPLISSKYSYYLERKTGKIVNVNLKVKHINLTRSTYWIVFLLQMFSKLTNIVVFIKLDAKSF